MKLYWVTTPDGYEDWFVVAKTKSIAERFHEHAEGYGNNYAYAKPVCSIPKDIYIRHIGEHHNSGSWPTHALLEDLGAKILTACNPRIVNIDGKVYKEGNFTEGIFLSKHNKSQGVYIIWVQNSKLYKIGMTTNLSQRLQQIKTSNPENIKLVYFVETVHYKSLEAHLHKIFKIYRGAGEWFYFSDDDLYELEMNLLYLEKEGSGMFKFYNIKKLSIHGDQY